MASTEIAKGHSLQLKTSDNLCMRRNTVADLPMCRLAGNAVQTLVY